MTIHAYGLKLRGHGFSHCGDSGVEGDYSICPTPVPCPKSDTESQSHTESDGMQKANKIFSPKIMDFEYKRSYPNTFQRFMTKIRVNPIISIFRVNPLIPNFFFNIGDQLVAHFDRLANSVVLRGSSCFKSYYLRIYSL